ncbi:acetyl esterase [Breoghania corrubedonensis]|uniref:Acetyl esterase n=1 Tax=Breoghania corrubedonensis TaxID=665038 RepID=A0A2T5US82_9HYPH|nr:alpha/beta hydrolase fold domain-containing protein [Breoghania corrubedonensis]PTW54372.1 acetyl esterase [Breoghania corrubedonensis]
MDYSSKLDREILAFIDDTLSFYPADLRADDWVAQRAVYDRMAAYFRAARPGDLVVCDRRIAGVPVRLYGDDGATAIVYAHGGGHVLGGLESHDDICAEIAAATGIQVIAVDYRLAPEHPHPAGYEDLLAVVRDISGDRRITLCGDSAGATLMASLVGTWVSPALAGQVLIYPALGYAPEGGSYEVHANAPLLSRDDIRSYGSARGASFRDATATPSAGDLSCLPPTFLYPAECDPLHDDCLRYRDQASAAGTEVLVETGEGLVHGWLRARHHSARAARAFSRICARLGSLAEENAL